MASSSSDNVSHIQTTAAAAATTTCRLSFHGAAANSSPHSLLWVRAPNNSATTTTTRPPTATATTQPSPSRTNNSNDDKDDDFLVDTVIYASSGVINLASSHSYLSNKITTVESTLVTRTVDAGTATATTTTANNTNATDGGISSASTKKVLARGEAVEDAAAPRSITALTWVANSNDNDDDDANEHTSWQQQRQQQREDDYYGIVAAFSDGTVTSWRYNTHNCNDDYPNATLPNNNGTVDGDGRDVVCRWEEHVLIGNDPQCTTTLTLRDGNVHDVSSTESSGDDAEHSQGVKFNRSDLHESIADISAALLDCRCGEEEEEEEGASSSTLAVATASSKGIFLHVSHVSWSSSSSSSSTTSVDNTTKTKNVEERVYSRQISNHATASVHLQCQNSNDDDSAASSRECYLFAGSASPRHNKVWVYTIPYYYHHPNNSNNNNNNCSRNFNDGNDDKTAPSAAESTTWVVLPLLAIGTPVYHGHLMGHQDWITCSAWLDLIPQQPRNIEEDNEMRKRGTSVSLLATSGHDAKIRLWKFACSSRLSTKLTDVTDIFDQEDNDDDDEDDINSDDDDNEDEANIDDLQEDEGEARLIITHALNRDGGGEVTAVSLEALLMGHEEAVTSLTWRPRRYRQNQPSGIDIPCLLSSSMDRTILLWMEEGYSEVVDGRGGGGIWTPISRVGSAGGILGGSIGASLMGFVDAAFSPDATRLVGHGYGGSIHFWTQVMQPKKAAIEKDLVDDVEEDNVLMTARWVADPCITGHFRSVEDMAWDPNGEYLLTTSSDQTTRLWMEVPISATACRWIEVGRPQVHGYDMTSIVCIGGGHDNIDENGGGEPRHRFVSGADEKVLRVFDAPASTLRLLQSIKQSRSAIQGTGWPFENSQSSLSMWRVERAFMPSLGLTNKASADTDQESSKYSGPVNDEAFAQTLDTVEGDCLGLKLPSERDLGVTTLWPEARKLFGHETELVCLDAYRAPIGSKESSLVASSCKARNDVASAAIRLWDANKGTCVGILKGGHRSTVSTMSFSRDGNYLASSGKDRRICIWKRTQHNTTSLVNGPEFELLAASDSAHKRIVWSVHFCPKRPDILASGSRDGMVKLWHIVDADDGSLEMKEISSFEPSFKSTGGKEPVTAIAFAEDLLRVDDENTYGILSIGTESGRIEVWAVPVSSSVTSHVSRPILLHKVPSNDSHFDTVKKIAWRPATASAESANNDGLTFASCGQDNGVRIYNFRLDSGVTKE